MKGFEEEKQSNEIKFFIPTLQQTEIVGRTISADAMHTQRESADYVVSQGAHFHFTVKGNQKNLFDAIETWFEMEAKHQKAAYQEPLDKDHGRITSRKIWMTDKLNDYVEFPHVNLVFAVQRTVKDPNGKKKDSVEIAFGVTSLSKDETSAQEVLQVNRGHWAVESTHWVLDNSHAFDEDASQIRCGHGPENMACMRRFALTVLRHYQRRSKKPPAITEMLYRLRFNPRRVLEYLKLTGNTRPRRAQRAPGREWLIAA